MCIGVSLKCLVVNIIIDHGRIGQINCMFIIRTLCYFLYFLYLTQLLCKMVKENSWSNEKNAMKLHR